MTVSGAGTITEILRQHPQGGRSLVDAVFPMLWWELRKLAHATLRREGRGASLETTELVGELYLKLVGGEAPGFEQREDFLRFCAWCVQRVLIDRGRYRHRQKRTGGVRCELKETDSVDQTDTIEVASVRSALERLSVLAPRQAQVVELRVVLDLSFDEIAEQLGVSRRTVFREWQTFRAWLARELQLKGPQD